MNINDINGNIFGVTSARPVGIGIPQEYSSPRFKAQNLRAFTNEKLMDLASEHIDCTTIVYQNVCNSKDKKDYKGIESVFYPECINLLYSVMSK